MCSRASEWTLCSNDYSSTSNRKKSDIFLGVQKWFQDFDKPFEFHKHLVEKTILIDGQTSQVCKFNKELFLVDNNFAKRTSFASFSAKYYSVKL